MTTTQRRTFIKSMITLGITPLLPNSLNAASSAAKRIKLAKGATILFQGDSITDGGRSRNTDWNHVMGHGYAYNITGRLCFEHPEKQYQFYNRGISGNTVDDLLNRWQKDTVDLKPTVLSILIGINDVAAEINSKPDFTAATYEEKYTRLLEVTRNSLPATQVIIGEPFLLPVGKVKANWKEWNDKVVQRQQLARALAEKFDAGFVPYQTAFNKALGKAPAEYWIWDGIHPMPAGHELMAREWMKVVKV